MKFTVMQYNPNTILALEVYSPFVSYILKVSCLFRRQAQDFKALKLNIRTKSPFASTDELCCYPFPILMTISNTRLCIYFVD
jgi:hypothetical protein